MNSPVFHALFLGLVQGLTEFLPISSSAHLVIFQNLFGMKEPELAFDVALHFGTLIAVLIYYFKDIVKIVSHVINGLLTSLKSFSFGKTFKSDSDFRLGMCVIIATIPTAIIGIVFKDAFETMFGSMRDTFIQLVINGGILWLSVIPYRKKVVPSKVIGFWIAIWIGIAQAVAIVPGISRSAMTIVLPLLLGVGIEESVKFSFLLSMVAILGAGVVEFRHGIPSSSFSGLEILLGSAVSLIVGYLSIAWLLRTVRNGKLYQFANYCLAVGILGLILHFWHHS